jgi:hypothetical protein
MSAIPEGRSYGPLTVVLGVGLLAMGVALAVQMIAAVVGPFDLLHGAAPVDALRLGVWMPASSGYDARNEGRRRARAWRAVLGRRVAVREGGSLAALVESGAAVVAVSDARSLGDDELAQLREYLRRGGAAIVAGPVAVRGADGAWRGTDAMARLLGVARIAALPREASSALAAARRGPLSAGLAPGQRLALLPEPGVPALDDPEAELRWAGDDASARGPRGASLRRELGAGRLVWLGAGPELSAAGATTPGGDFARLAAAAFAWAAREPYAEALPLAAAPGEPRYEPASPSPLAAELRRLGPQRHLLEVTNRGASALAHGVVRVHLNRAALRVAMGRTVLQQDEPRWRFDARAQHVDVRLPELPAGRSLGYTLDLDAAAEAGS